MVETLGMGSMLVVCSVFDLWKKQIPLVVLFIFGVTGLGYQVMYGKLSLWDVIWGVMVGGVLYIISLVTGERIGKGDAVMLMCTGSYLGFWTNVVLLWVGSVLTGVVCLALYVFRKKGRNASVPFAPFLLAAYLVIFFVRG